jgi:hypothetical protein
MAALEDYHLTDGRMSLTEKDTLPIPYLRAYVMIAQHLARAQAWRSEHESKK